MGKGESEPSKQVDNSSIAALAGSVIGVTVPLAIPHLPLEVAIPIWCAAGGMFIYASRDWIKARLPTAWRRRKRLIPPPSEAQTEPPRSEYDDEWEYLDAKDRGEHVNRDKSLAEALAFIAHRAWGREYTQATADMIPNALSDFRQRAHDGKLTVWGRFHPDELYRPIPQEHWSDHRVDPGALLNGYARTWGGDTTSYGHLMVSRAEIEKEWPHEG